jgi:hypothetical protein
MTMKYISMILKSILLCNLAFCAAAIPVFPNSSKIVVIADVHADITRFKSILMDADILDESGRWIAVPNTVVVQLGDQIDPKAPDAFDIDDTHHFKMIYYTDSLKKMANANNCDFISMIGNHELYNLDKIKKKEELHSIIAKRPVLLKLGEYIFCHGGFKAQHYRLLSLYSKQLTDVNTIWTKYVNDVPLLANEETLLNSLILHTEDSILFTRTPDTKADIDSLFRTIGIDYMFVGHTAFQYLHLKYKVWYLDLYLKDAFEAMIYSYLVIEDDNIMIKHLDESSVGVRKRLLDYILSYTIFGQ